MSRLMSVPTEVKLKKKKKKKTRIGQNEEKKVTNLQSQESTGNLQGGFPKFGDIVDSVSSDHPATLAGLMVLNFVTGDHTHIFIQ